MSVKQGDLEQNENNGQPVMVPDDSGDSPLSRDHDRAIVRTAPDFSCPVLTPSDTFTTSFRCTAKTRGFESSATQWALLNDRT